MQQQHLAHTLATRPSEVVADEVGGTVRRNGSGRASSAPTSAHLSVVAQPAHRSHQHGHRRPKRAAASWHADAALVRRRADAGSDTARRAPRAATDQSQTGLLFPACLRLLLSCSSHALTSFRRKRQCRQYRAPFHLVVAAAPADKAHVREAGISTGLGRRQPAAPAHTVGLLLLDVLLRSICACMTYSLSTGSVASRDLTLCGDKM